MFSRASAAETETTASSSKAEDPLSLQSIAFTTVSSSLGDQIPLIHYQLRRPRKYSYLGDAVLRVILQIFTAKRISYVRNPSWAWDLCICSRFRSFGIQSIKHSDRGALIKTNTKESAFQTDCDFIIGKVQEWMAPKEMEIML